MNTDESRATRRQVGILVFDDVEVLDFCGPFEVFSVTNAPGESGDETKRYDVHLIARNPDLVSCRNGLIVQPHFTIEHHPDLDIVLVPGGRGTRQAQLDPRILAWLKEQDARTELMTSVCTGAFLLAAGGLLDGIAATTHWASIETLREAYPSITVHDDRRFVDQGRVITSAGVSAGIDMALHVVERLDGAAIALQTARYMEYAWRP